MQTKITYTQALQILNHQDITPLGITRVFLHDALGRILAKDIIATSNMPTHPLSNMDAYAINSKFKDCKTFTILQENPAGNKEIPTLPLDKPYAIKTFTGAPIPHNADIIIPIEYAITCNNTLSPTQIPHINQFIRKIGDNYKKGEILLTKGTLLNANHIGLLASLNCVFVEVFERVKVGILVSGNELLELGENMQSCTQTYNANGHLLYAKIKELGGIAKLYPILKDNENCIKDSIICALKECDLVLSSGGASVGDYDFITAFCKQRESEIIFKGVQIKPGQHITYARFNNKPFFALPGFPNSTLVTFEIFAKIILKKLSGANFSQTLIQAKLKEKITKNDTRLELRVCNVRNENGSFNIDFIGKKDFQSAILNNFTPLDRAKTGLCILDCNKEIGDIVEVILLDF